MRTRRSLLSITRYTTLLLNTFHDHVAVFRYLPRQHPLWCWRMDGLGDVLGGGCHALSPLIQPPARHTLWVTAARAHCIPSSRISTLSPRMCMLLTLALGQHHWRMDTLGTAGVGTVPCIAHPLTPQRDTRPGWLHAHARLLDVIRCETGFRGRASPSHTLDA